MSHEERSELFQRAEEFLSLFNRGAEFTRELLEENARLRRRLAEVEIRQDSAARSSSEWEKLRGELLGRIRDLEEERSDAVERLHEAVQENRDFAERYVTVAEENDSLASLYVASYQLHSTLELSEVLQVVIEIVINLIGAERFAIYAIDERTGRLEPVACEGGEPGEFPAMTSGEGAIGESVARGETFLAAPEEAADPARPLACVPLRVGNEPLGAIAIFRLLEQKRGLTPLDHELFGLLARHAATSIFAARLYGQSERKLQTIQGFIDLLTQ
jgi:GAF domain-containing protein